MVATVETRTSSMATAVPVMPLLAAGVLDATAGPVRVWIVASSRNWTPAVSSSAVRRCSWPSDWRRQQARFYFGTYADRNRWPQRRSTGGRSRRMAAAARWSMTIGGQSHRDHSGWVRLLAPKGVRRVAIQSPGSALPLALPPTRSSPSSCIPEQAAYLPLLREPDPGEIAPPLHVPERGRRRQLLRGADGVRCEPARKPRQRAQTGREPGCTARRGSSGTAPARATLERGYSQVPAIGTTVLRCPVPVSLRLDIGKGSGVPAGRGCDGRTGARARPPLRDARRVATRARGGPKLEWRVAAASSRAGRSSSLASRSRHTSSSPDDAGLGLTPKVTRRRSTGNGRLDGTIARLLAPRIAGEALRRRMAGNAAGPSNGTYRSGARCKGRRRCRSTGGRCCSSRRTSDDTAARTGRSGGPHSVGLRYRVAGRPAPWNGGGRRRVPARASCLPRHSSLHVRVRRPVPRPRSLRCSPWSSAPGRAPQRRPRAASTVGFTEAPWPELAGRVSKRRQECELRALRGVGRGGGQTGTMEGSMVRRRPHRR